MRRSSRRATLLALVLPGVLSLIAALTVAILLMSGSPISIVMQWSGDEPSRYASPAELLLLPVIAMALNVLIWLLAPTGSARDAQLGIAVGNGVNAVLNASAITLLVGQLDAPATGALPIGALALSFLAGILVAIATYLSARRGLE